MSRFVDECRARARHAAGCAYGYRLAGDRDLARAAERIALGLAQAVEDIEALARMEASAADRAARDTAPVVLFESLPCRPHSLSAA